MKPRLYRPDDYAEISEWFAAHGSGAVPEAMLPKLGVVVEDEKGPAAAAWCYMDNSVGCAWLAWIVTNPRMKPFEAKAALDELFRGAQIAIPGEYGILFTMTERPALGRFLQRNGFVKNHVGMTQYFKQI